MVVPVPDENTEVTGTAAFVALMFLIVVFLQYRREIQMFAEAHPLLFKVLPIATLLVIVLVAIFLPIEFKRWRC